MCHNKNNSIYSSIFLSHKKKLKSKKGNENWTFLRMSKNENPKRVLKMTLFSRGLEHNALKSILYIGKTVMPFFGKNIYRIL